jgi:hypothetical protein
MHHRGIFLCMSVVLSAFCCGCIGPGEGGIPSNAIDVTAGSLTDRRNAERAIVVLVDSTAGYTRIGGIASRRCHHNAFDSEPTEDALTHDLKIAAYGAGADAIKVTSISKENGLLADCWYVLEGHADTYRKM